MERLQLSFDEDVRLMIHSFSIDATYAWSIKTSRTEELSFDVSRLNSFAHEKRIPAHHLTSQLVPYIVGIEKIIKDQKSVHGFAIELLDSCHSESFSSECVSTMMSLLPISIASTLLHSPQAWGVHGERSSWSFTTSPRAECGTSTHKNPFSHEYFWA